MTSSSFDCSSTTISVGGSPGDRDRVTMTGFTEDEVMVTASHLRGSHPHSQRAKTTGTYHLTDRTLDAPTSTNRVTHPRRGFLHQIAGGRLL